MEESSQPKFYKQCAVCGEALAIENFYKNKNSKFGVASICKKCARSRRREYFKSHKKEESDYRKKYYKENKEKLKENRKQHYSTHKVEAEEYNKKYYEKNKEKRKKHRRQYCETFPERVKETKKQHRKSHKETINQYTRRYRWEKYRSDPTYRLRHCISNAIRRAIKDNGGSKKGCSCLNFLPYAISQLREHLEKQFIGENSWMTWDNYGIYEEGKQKWNIDHIVPQSLLFYDSMEHPNFQKSWALHNLRPLEVSENCSKGNRLESLASRN